MNEGFTPRIIAFLCNWCSYAGADSAGAQHKDVPAGIREGADGVMVLGCHPGDCHYKSGNYKALRRLKLFNELLAQFGIEKERFFFDWVSAGEGDKFSKVTCAMVETVRNLGPLTGLRAREASDAR